MHNNVHHMLLLNVLKLKKAHKYFADIIFQDRISIMYARILLQFFQILVLLFLCLWNLLLQYYQINSNLNFQSYQILPWMIQIAYHLILNYSVTIFFNSYFIFELLFVFKLLSTLVNFSYAIFKLPQIIFIFFSYLTCLLLPWAPTIFVNFSFFITQLIIS